MKKIYGIMLKDGSLLKTAEAFMERFMEVPRLFSNKIQARKCAGLYGGEVVTVRLEVEPKPSDAK